MSKKEKQRPQHYREEFEEAERDKSLDKSSKSVVAESSSDDNDEANEDLTLKLVEKALLMRAAKLVADNDGGSVEPERSSGLLDLLPSSSSQEVQFVEGPARLAGREVVIASENGVVEKKKKIIKRVKKKKTSKVEIEDTTVSVFQPFALFVSVENYEIKKLLIFLKIYLFVIELEKLMVVYLLQG